MKTGLKVMLFSLIGFLALILIFSFIPQKATPPPRESSAVLEYYPKKIDNDIPKITAKAALVRFVSKSNGREEDLFSKNHKEPLPIASVSKLMTALVATEILDKEKPIAITESIANDKGSSNVFKANEEWDFDSLLHLMLIQSNNDAAEALASSYDAKKFIDLMNGKSFEIGMIDTHYINESGLDEGEKSNISNADDLAKLILYIQNKYSSILQKTRIDDYKTSDVSRTHGILATSTNALLRLSSFPLKIIGGKTGETPKAKKNLVLLTEAPACHDCGAGRPSKNGYIVIVVLQSEDHFKDIATLANWSVDSFDWR